MAASFRLAHASMTRSPPILAVILALVTLTITGVIADFGPLYNDKDFEDGIWGSYPRQSFLSLPGAEAPVANIIVKAQQGVSPGRHLVYTPQGPIVHRAWPMILDSTDLSLVWSGPPSHMDTLNGDVHECNNTQYLTFWYGGLTRGGWRGGEYYLLDDKYRHVFNVTARGNLTHADGHEFTLTPQCTALYTSYMPRQAHAVIDGLATDYNLDSYFQEIDLATGDILFQWNASQHVDIQDTYWSSSVRNSGQSSAHGFDWFHINSVEKDSKGNYLVSSRHTHSIYYVSGSTGDIIWQLGGKRNMFRDLSNGTATDFKWQHHVRWVDTELTKISIFDNRITQWHPDQRDSTSRGIIVSLDYDKMEARLEHEYSARNGIGSTREGSMQVLPHTSTPGYNVLLGYGQEPAVTEFSQRGDVLWDAMLAPLGMNRQSPDNYRWSKVDWNGAPLTIPDIAPGPPSDYHFAPLTSVFSVRLNDSQGQPLNNDTVYFSWNGATHVSSWAVLASNSTSDLNAVEHFWTEVPKTGFESSVYVGEGTKNVAILAISSDDNVLAMSQLLDMSDGQRSGGLKQSMTREGEPVYDTDAMTASLQEYRTRHSSSKSNDLPFSVTHMLFALGALSAVLLLARQLRPLLVGWYSASSSSCATDVDDTAVRYGPGGARNELDDDEMGALRDQEEKGLLERPGTSASEASC